MKKLIQNRYIKCFSLILLFALLGYLQIVIFYPNGQVLEGDDLIFHVNRIYGLAQSIQSRQFPFYINQLFLGGYGYASNWFYSDLFLLPAAGLVLLNVDFVSMFKIYIIIMTVCTGLAMYYCTFKITKKDSIAWFASILYVLCNYRFVDIFVRSAIGEAISFIFLPFVVYGTYELLFGDRKKWYILTFAFTALLFSHVLSAVLAFILLLAMCIIYYKQFITDYKRIFSFLIAGFVALFTSAFFLFPFFEQFFAQTYWFQTTPLTSIADNALPVSNILQGIFLNKTFEHGIIYFGIGLIIVLPLFLRIFLQKQAKDPLISLADRLCILSFIFLFLVSDIFPWRFLEVFNLIQFPWRFYGIISLLISISGAIYISKMNFKTIHYYAISAGIIISCLGLTYLTIDKELYNSRNVFWSKESIIVRDYTYNIGAGKEYLPASIDVWTLYYREDNTVFYQKDTTEILGFTRENQRLILNYKTNGSDVFELPLVYYPGYKAIQNNVPLEIQKSSNSLVEVKVNSIQGEIVVSYAGTMIQKSSFWISLLSCIGVIGYYFLTFKKKPSSNL